MRGYFHGYLHKEQEQTDSPYKGAWERRPNESQPTTYERLRQVLTGQHSPYKGAWERRLNESQPATSDKVKDAITQKLHEILAKPNSPYKD